jgi:hypothetical protein
MLSKRQSYALKHLGCESGRVFFGEDALRTMVKDILAATHTAFCR